MRPSLVCLWFVVLTFVGSAPTASASPQSAGDPEFYLKRGEALCGARQHDRAIADYTTAIQLKPDYAEAYNDRGFAYYLKGNGERAIADFTRAIELRPNYPKAYNSRGVAYMSHGLLAHQGRRADECDEISRLRDSIILARRTAARAARLLTAARQSGH